MGPHAGRGSRAGGTAGRRGAAVRQWLILCAAALALPVAAPAAGAVTWTQQAVPAAQAPNGQFFSASCASGTACTGVGFFINSLGEQRPLAEVWNGTSWTVRG